MPVPAFTFTIAHVEIMFEATSPESFKLPLPSHDARSPLVSVPVVVAKVVVFPLAAPEDNPFDPLPKAGRLLVRFEPAVTRLLTATPESFAFPLASQDATLPLMSVPVAVASSVPLVLVRLVAATRLVPEPRMVEDSALYPGRARTVAPVFTVVLFEIICPTIHAPIAGEETAEQFPGYDAFVDAT